MNWSQFKDPVSYMCLAGAVVASWSPTQEVAGSNPFPVIKFFILNPILPDLVILCRLGLLKFMLT